MFIQDLPAVNKSPINTPQNTQGTTNATAKMVLLIFSPGTVLGSIRHNVGSQPRASASVQADWLCVIPLCNYFYIFYRTEYTT